MMRTGHMPGSLASTLLAVLCCVVAGARADSITLRGSEIPLRGLTIQQIRNGELYYLDGNGRLTQRALDEVSALGFDALSELDQAEHALDDDERDVALTKMLQALLKADTDVQKLWLHARLSRVHNFRGEYVPAAGHAAAAMLIEPSPYWRVLEPTCEPSQSSYAAAKESDDLLRDAAHQVSDGTLRAVIARMREVVQPLRRALEQHYNGPPIADGSTWSGFSKSVIERGRLFEGADHGPDHPGAAPPHQRPSVDDAAPDQPRIAPGDESPADSEPDRPTSEGNSGASGATSTSPPAADSGGAAAAPIETTPPSTGDDASADDIDTLLDDGDFAQALESCQQAAQNVADRDVGKLLLQWGRALEGTGRPRDAAVKFTECAILFSGTASGVEALIETASVYDRVYNRPGTSRRLLLRAVEQAELQGREELTDRARKALTALGRSGNR